MTSSDALWDISWIQIWGSVLLHFCWQGMVIAGGYRVVLLWNRLHAPAHRHLAAWLAMLLLAAAPMVTFVWHCHVPVTSHGESDFGVDESPSFVAGDSPISRESALSWNGLGRVLPSSGVVVWLSSQIATIRAVMVIFWCMGQFVGGVRNLHGLFLVREWRRSSEALSSEVVEMTRKLTLKMGLRRQPLVRATRHLADAAAIGLWRGCVLIPAAWLAELSPPMLEAVIVHELSHLRRNDAWFMVLQRLMETAFFFHPAVWWLSREIRDSREQCCDEEAVKVLGSRLLYGQLLEWAARYQIGDPVRLVPHLGDDRMSLLDRIRRVLGEPVASQSGHCWAAGLLALAVPLLGTVAATTQAQSNSHSSLQPTKKQASVVAPDEPFYSVEIAEDDSISFEEAGELVSHYGSLLRQRKMKEAERFIHHLTSVQRAHPVVQVLVKYAGTLEEREQAPNTQQMHFRTYNVARLVAPVHQRPTDDGVGTLPTTAAADYDALVDLVKQTIEPYSWDDAGGEASLRVFPSNLSLVIKQTPAGHDAISELLSRLHEIQDKSDVGH